MDKIRIDNVTRKRYTHDNIPIGRIHSVSNENGSFRIFEYNYKHPDSSWQDGRFKGTSWAVFKYDDEIHDYVRISAWYFNFGNAQRYMLEKC